MDNININMDGFDQYLMETMNNFLDDPYANPPVDPSLFLAGDNTGIMFNNGLQPMVEQNGQFYAAPDQWPAPEAFQPPNPPSTLAVAEDPRARKERQNAERQRYLEKWDEIYKRHKSALRSHKAAENYTITVLGRAEEYVEKCFEAGGPLEVGSPALARVSPQH